MENYKIGVVGLGYVGLPVAVAFGKKSFVTGFDISTKRIHELSQGIDTTNEVPSHELAAATIYYTTNPQDLAQCNFIIVSVPTPIKKDNQPDLTPILSASRTIGRYLKPDTIVVYESTVYPGLTEEECIPTLEQFSNMRAGVDFHVGYSPERINPGDKKHTFTNIQKIVAGQTPALTNRIAAVYEQVVTAGVYKASSIKVAEAAKIIENTQRDLNIAFMNELALLFNVLDINTSEVLKAASTKWNFLNFTPGLVGGHCIGVDPYYLTYKAQQVGYNPELILTGRHLNDSFPAQMASIIVKKLHAKGVILHEALVTVLGVTFKENVPDIRNTKVAALIRELEAYGVSIQLQDPYADAGEVYEQLELRLSEEHELVKSDAVIVAVAHDEYIKKSWPYLTSLLAHGDGIVVDIKSCLDPTHKPALVTHMNF